MLGKTKKVRNKRSHNKTSKRVLNMENNPTSVWGKNKPLEKFWRGLASGKKVVLIYKNGKNKQVNLPDPTTPKYTKMYGDFVEDKDIVAILSSNASQDAYEVFLYPKAKQSSVEHVIQTYKKYFKPMVPGSKEMVPG